MNTKEQNTGSYLEAFSLFEKGLNGAGEAPLHRLRRSAMARFGELGFPTRRDEEWKYTDITPITRTPFRPAGPSPAGLQAGAGAAELPLWNLTPHRLVCVNGSYVPELSSTGLLPRGVIVGGLSHALATDRKIVEAHLGRHADFRDNAFIALNTAFLRDGVFLHVPQGVILEDPVQIVSIASGGAAEFAFCPRVLVIAGDNSQTSIIESHVGMSGQPYLVAAVSELVLGENSVVEYDRLQNDGDTGYHIGATTIRQSRNSNFTSNVFTFGGAIVRNNVMSILDGEGCESTLNGLYFGSGSQLMDNHTAIDHARAHCNSHEMYKGILDDRSRGVFNGKIFVRANAQKTDAKQTNKNLILSDLASVDTKPQLEIFANDVKCTHGATIGQLEEEHLFYLQSRGIGREAARDMLIYAFASDVIDRTKIGPLRDLLHDMLNAKLAHTRRSGRP